MEIVYLIVGLIIGALLGVGGVILFKQKKQKVDLGDFKKDLENLLNKIKENNTILLTTEKDYFRIVESHKKNIKCLKIKIEIENLSQFIEEIKKII